MHIRQIVRRSLALLLALSLGQAAQAFTHPGLQFSHADLVRIKANALSNKEPWKSEYALFLADTAVASYVASPVVNETIGTGQFQIRADAGAAADLALKWYITGDASYKTAAINIINAWSSTMQTFDPADNLSASVAAKSFGEAAEILQYEGSGWAPADVTKFKNMMLNLLYPAVAKSKTDAMTGNQGIDAIGAAMAIGIVCDVQQYFDDGVASWTTHPCCAVQNFILPSGQMGEAGRDQPHSSGEIMCADEWALFAWNQGVDLYSAANNRLLAGFEYWCKYNFGNDVSFQQMTNCNYTYGSMPDADRGRFAYVYTERVYHHYVTVMGVPAPPYLQQAVLRMRPNPWGLGGLRWYSGSATTVAQLIANGAYPIVSRLNNMAVGVANDSTINSAQLVMENYSARPSQLWTFTHMGGNIYSVINQQGKATDIPGSSTDTGLKVQIYTPHAGLAQYWRAVKNPDGTLSFLNANSSWGMTIGGGNMAPFSGVVQDYMPATPNSPFHQEWTIGTPSSAPPAVATGLFAESSNGKIVLSWAVNALTTGYTVKRATTSGGTYTTLASSVTTTSYADTAVTNGTTYYYVVSASNQNGPSADSAPLAAPAGLPAPWSEGDLGSVGTAGSASFDTAGTFTVNGSGGDIGGSADAGHYVYKSLTGDGSITARMVSASSGKRGLMLRESLASNAASVSLLLDGVAPRMCTRSTTGGGSNFVNGPNVSLPEWLRVKRAGNVFTTSTSDDGITWTTIGSTTVNMAGTINMGLVMCSRGTGLGTITLDNALGYIQVEGESYSGGGGVSLENCSEGGQDVAFISNNDYTFYNSINVSGASAIDIRVASQTSGGTIEVRAGSATGILLGAATVANTGGWQTWVTVSAPISGAAGAQKIYLVYKGGTGNLFNVNWFKFR